MKNEVFRFTLLLLILVAGSTLCWSQTHLKLILKTTVPIDGAYVGHFTDKEFTRLPFAETLEFDFNSKEADFYHINYLQNEKIYNQRLFLDSGNITISMSIVDDKLVVDQVVGSPIFDMIQEWRKRYAVELVRKDPDAMDAFLLKTYEEQIDNLYSFSIGSRYLALHENEKLKLYALLPLIARQNDALKQRFGFSMMNDRLQGVLKNSSVKLADLDLIDKQNRTVRATGKSDFTILDFWFVGCAPCIEDHKKVKKLMPVLRQKHAEFVSISNDESYSTWINYLRKNAYNWRQYKKPAAPENIVTQLGITTYPTYLVIDKTGQILFSTRSLDEAIRHIPATPKGR